MAAATDFYPLTIAALVREPGDGLIVTFEVPPSLAETFRFKPGQHIAVRAMVESEELRRSYSIAAGPNEPLRIAIKRVDDGRFSNWASAELAVGATLDVMPPQGRFVLSASEGAKRHIIAIAAGSGITPIVGIARQALLHEPNTRFTLLYGNRARDQILLGEELEALKDRYLGRFDYLPVFSRSGEVESSLLEGRITGEKIKALGASRIDFSSAERIFLCGPGGLIKDVRDALTTLGVARDAIAFEFFAAGGGAYRAIAAKTPPPTSQATPSSGKPVAVILDGIRHQLHLVEGETVLQAALKAGLKAPYACSGGMCSTCRARIVSGSARMLLNYSLEPWEIEKGFTLACQAVPTSELLVVDWDAM